MKLKEFSWSLNVAKYATGSYCSIGPINVGKTHYEVGTKGEPAGTKHWVATCLLPQSRVETERYATEKEAKNRVEAKVKAWFSAVTQKDF